MDLANLRLRNQLIDGSRLTDPAEAVRALCAVQAQDYYSSLWAVGLRLRNGCEADVERAINERRIVRTWPMRGTLHLVAAEDVHWLLNLLAPRVLQRQAARVLREFAIDRALLKRAAKIVEQALRGGQATRRSSLYERFETEKISTDRQRGLHILWWLANDGLICCGPRAGKQHTFVLLDEWIPSTPALRREEALAKLAQRYFAHHGPATLADFVWWSGLTTADAQASIEAVESELTEERVGHTTYWSGLQQRARRRVMCHLLPVYDEYAVGYADRTACLDPAHAKHAAAGHGIFRAPIVIDGRIVGSWTRELGKKRVEIRVTPLARFDRQQRQAIEEAGARYGRYLGLDAAVAPRPRR
jgi:hypothetical protein